MCLYNYIIHYLHHMLHNLIIHHVMNILNFHHIEYSLMNQSILNNYLNNLLIFKL